MKSRPYAASITPASAEPDEHAGAATSHRKPHRDPGAGGDWSPLDIVVDRGRAVTVEIKLDIDPVTPTIRSARAREIEDGEVSVERAILGQGDRT